MTVSDSEKVLWTQLEVIKNLNLGKTTIQNMTASGELPSIKIGRRRLYPVAQIMEWISTFAASDANGNA